MHHIQGEKSQVKVTRPINARMENRLHLPTGEADKLETHDMSGTLLLIPPASGVTLKVKVHGNKVIWTVRRVC